MDLPFTMFPSVVRTVSDPVLSSVTQKCAHSPIGSFSVVVRAETLEIPYRVYSDPQHLERFAKPRSMENAIANCIYSRHHDGYLRQRCIETLMDISEPWVMPFIVQLIGEYVIEILDSILSRVNALDQQEIGTYLAANQGHWVVTKSRVTSYWNCYYRNVSRAQYPGYKLIDIFNEITGLR